MFDMITRLFGNKSGQLNTESKDNIYVFCLIFPWSMRGLENYFRRWRKKYWKRHNLPTFTNIETSKMSNKEIRIIGEKILLRSAVGYSSCKKNTLGAMQEALSCRKLNTLEHIENCMVWSSLNSILRNAIVKKNVSLEISSLSKAEPTLGTLQDFININLLKNGKSDHIVSASCYNPSRHWGVQVADLLSDYLYRVKKGLIPDRLYLYDSLYQNRIVEYAGVSP